MNVEQPTAGFRRPSGNDGASRIFGIVANRDARAGNIKLAAFQLISRQPLRRLVIYICDVVPVKNRCQAGIIELGIKHPAFCDPTKLNEPVKVFCQGITTAQPVVKSNKPIVVHVFASVVGQWGI